MTPRLPELARADRERALHTRQGRPLWRARGAAARRHRPAGRRLGLELFRRRQAEVADIAKRPVPRLRRSAKRIGSRGPSGGVGQQRAEAILRRRPDRRPLQHPWRSGQWPFRTDPPPPKWSALSGIEPELDRDGEQETQA